ncbi:MAG: DUF1801 domain-containing protein [Patescibacteria group bacterium]
MVSSDAKTVEAYLAGLLPDRREAIGAVRDVIRKHLPEGYEEGMQYGMISFFIPLERYPDTYNGQPLAIASIAPQKNHMAVYLMCIYGHAGEEAWFRKEFEKAGKKLDMGKSCVRFRKLEDLPLEVIGEAVARMPVDAFIMLYESSRGKR